MLNVNITNHNLDEVKFEITVPINGFIEVFHQLFSKKIQEFEQESLKAVQQEEDMLCRMAVCKLLKISQTTLTKRIKERKIPYSQVGRRLLFSKQAVLESIKKGA